MRWLGGRALGHREVNPSARTALLRVDGQEKKNVKWEENSFSDDRDGQDVQEFSTMNGKGKSGGGDSGVMDPNWSLPRDV